ncbi:DNA-3-methyladenine glycosylase family protein [Terrihabitans sp. B22-R8]|uniref:DNA-3-methyladenine glycosylase family protein n=1 Tax=Terrihabitans sp. B22-R8 TaxID=3425128 RepID=UPI00403D47AB
MKPVVILPNTPLPPAIANEDDLAAHLRALILAAPDLAAVAERAGAIPLRKLSPDFAGLAWVVVGQQISVAAGRAIFNRLEIALGGHVSAGAVMAAGDDDLRGAGLSIQKIRTLRASAAEIAAGLDLAVLARTEAENAIAEMCRIKGVGRWTAEVFLLFAVGHADVFPAGDLALQEAARLAFGLDERPGEKALRQRAEGWRPNRGIAARLLWAYYRVAKSGRDTTPV